MFPVNVYYVPQCPWVFPTLHAVRKTSENLGANYNQYDLLRIPNQNFRTLFMVYVNDRPVPIGIGMTDENIIKDIISSSLGKEHIFIPEEPIEPSKSCVVKAVTKKLSIKSLSPENFKDEINLCVGEDFLYGLLPTEHVGKARESKRKWLKYLLKKISTCGYIAYSGKNPIGFIEFVPGCVAEDMGMAPVHPSSKTCVILCLSVTSKHWRRGVGSKLLSETVKCLRKEGYKYLEVTSNKHGVWHPESFYIKNGFKIIEERKEKSQMFFELADV